MRTAFIALALFAVAGAGIQMKRVHSNLAYDLEAINAAWSQVDAALQRRADLIPGLAEAVKGHIREEQTPVELADARTAMKGARTPGEKIQAYEQIQGALGRLIAIAESDPKLNSSEKFRRLKDELSDTDNRIREERGKYNEAVQRYNTGIGLFPNNIVAGVFNFARNEAYFKTDTWARGVPK